MNDDEIRTLLHDAVADVEPRHGAEAILDRATPVRGRSWVWGAAAAAVATAAVVAAVTTGLGGRPDPGPGIAARPSTAHPSTSADVSVDSPAPGADVRSPFTVTGSASTFEANVQWELEQHGRVVRRGFTTARECCTLSPYSFRVSAPPGSYTLVVHGEDVSDGEGTAAARTTTTLTVLAPG